MRTRMALGAAIFAMFVAGEGVAAEPVAGPGGWMTTDEVSPLDGAHRFVAVLASDNQLTNIIGRPEYAVLRVRCGVDGFAVEVLWPDFVTANFGYHDTMIEWRLDSGAVQKWQMQADLQSVSKFGKGAWILVGEWRGGQRLVLRLPDRHGAQDASFKIGDLGTVIDRARAAGCS